MRRLLWFVMGFAVALFVVNSIQAQAAAPCVTVTAAPTKAATLAATVAATAVADDPNFGTQDNPVPLGVTHAITFQDGAVLSMKITKVTRGAKVLQAVLNANQFNDKPADGSEYMQVQIAVVYVSVGTSSAPFTINWGDFQSLSDGELTPALNAVGLSNQFANAPFFVKAKIEHISIIPVKVDDKTPLIAFAVNTDGTGGDYFSLTAN